MVSIVLNTAQYFPQGGGSGLCLRLYCFLPRERGWENLELAAWTEAQEILTQFLGSLECEGWGYRESRTRGSWPESSRVSGDPEARSVVCRYMNDIMSAWPADTSPAAVALPSLGAISPAPVDFDLELLKKLRLTSWGLLLKPSAARSLAQSHTSGHPAGCGGALPVVTLHC